ncbi:MAG: GHMP kinase [Candidatus Thermoplasmatota archaeon]|nr:GHMP kinase [Candidatus Thermoplasmatota archaeon]
MIISRTPVRVSFCGGGTDLPAYYEGSENGGLVTSLALAKHIHVTVNKRFDNSVRVGYSQTEIVDDFEDLEHELVREAMRLTGVTDSVEITTIADIPSRGTGLGSSSALTVGLLNALHTYAGHTPDAAQLAEEACRIEIEILGQPIGRQDQYAAAFGGSNQIAFLSDDSVIVNPIELDAETLASNYFLVYTGITRKASDILVKQSASTDNKRTDLDVLRQQAVAVRNALELGDHSTVGQLLGASWQIKRNLVDGITATALDELYTSVIELGATGGKLLGAGGGGFFLFQGPSEIRTQVEKTHKVIPLVMDSAGSTIIFDDGSRL